MKKIKLPLIGVLLSLCLAGCQSSQSSPIDNAPESSVTGENNVLVAYFSYSGNTQKVARTISEQLNSDIFRIVVSDPYTNDTLFDRAQQEVNSKAYPELSSHIETDVFASYDTIIIGFPVWWYDLPRPVATFVTEYDFAKKTVIPFFTHNGSSSGASSLTTLGSLLPDSNYRKDDALSLRGSNVDNSNSSIIDWVAGLNL